MFLLRFISESTKTKTKKCVSKNWYSRLKRVKKSTYKCYKFVDCWWYKIHHTILLYSIGAFCTEHNLRNSHQFILIPFISIYIYTIFIELQLCFLSIRFDLILFEFIFCVCFVLWCGTTLLNLFINRYNFHLFNGNSMILLLPLSRLFFSLLSCFARSL